MRQSLTVLLRQSIYRRLAGYEDVNDAARLAVDRVMRQLVGGMQSTAPALAGKRNKNPGTFTTSMTWKHWPTPGSIASSPFVTSKNKYDDMK